MFNYNTSRDYQCLGEGYIFLPLPRIQERISIYYTYSCSLEADTCSHYLLKMTTCQSYSNYYQWLYNVAFLTEFSHMYTCYFWIFRACVQTRYQFVAVMYLLLSHQEPLIIVVKIAFTLWIMQLVMVMACTSPQSHLFGKGLFLQAGQFQHEQHSSAYSWKNSSVLLCNIPARVIFCILSMDSTPQICTLT